MKKEKYIKLSEAIKKFTETNARNFDLDQIVYLLNRVPAADVRERTGACGICKDPNRSGQEYDHSKSVLENIREGNGIARKI